MLEYNFPYLSDEERADVLAAFVTCHWELLPTPTANSCVTLPLPELLVPADFSRSSTAFCKTDNEVDGQNVCATANELRAANFTRSELHALLLYSAGKDGSSAFYQKLNAALVDVRKYVGEHNATPTTADCPSWDIVHGSMEYFRHFFRGLAKLPLYRGECYRGIKVGADFDIAVGIQEDLQGSKAGRNGVVFIIKSQQSGRFLDGISMYPDEAEVLFPPNTAFIVNERPWQDDDGRWCVYLDESDFVFKDPPVR